MGSRENAGGSSCDEITWWDAQYGGNLVGTGEVFDPIASGDVDPSAAGEYTFWAQCNCPCPSLRTPATFEVIDVILSPLADIGPVCPDGEVGDILLSAQPFDPNIVYSWTGGALAGLPDGNSTGLNPHIPGFTVGVTEGVWTVTVTATLGACTDMTTFDIEIGDSDGLHWVNCPANIMVGNDVDECGAYVNWTPPRSYRRLRGARRCGRDPNLALPLTAGSFFPISGFSHTIEYTAEDSNGNVMTCEFTVTLVDTQNPERSLPGLHRLPRRKWRSDYYSSPARRRQLRQLRR
ncbi:MAG: HYR domain-containing protein [Saprospirales bacterium]|nr:HYR domain-containing protein [Saprospirales bacterium]